MSASAEALRGVGKNAKAFSPQCAEMLKHNYAVIVGREFIS